MHLLQHRGNHVLCEVVTCLCAPDNTFVAFVGHLWSKEKADGMAILPSELLLPCVLVVSKSDAPCLQVAEERALRAHTPRRMAPKKACAMHA